MKKSFYITSPIFYPNANLHMGHAYTMTVCDIIARYHCLAGDKTYFLAGSDENTGKVVKSASEAGKDVSTFLAEINQNFKNLYESLSISYDQFINTTDKKRHWPGALAVWKKLDESGDLYKGSYEGLYCMACEAFYTEKDLIDGKCPQHGTVPEKIKEENYFFKLSKYTDVIKEKIENNEMKVVPESRRNEILALLGRGLDDVSFSRPIKNVPHGIPVPNDPTQVIYVWCDALVNYISALGFGTDDQKLFKDFWPANVQVLGKDILRFHAAIWPAMLLSAGLPLPKNLFVHGLITSGGKKMSKSLGNIIDPVELIETYGGDAVRYYLAREISPFEDGDLTMDSFKNAYNANLANSLGNLTSRILKMASSYEIKVSEKDLKPIPENAELDRESFEAFNLKKVADNIWGSINHLDLIIQREQPFKLIKTDPEKANHILKDLLVSLYDIALRLEPFMPETAQIIQTLIKENKMPEKPLFARRD